VPNKVHTSMPPVGRHGACTGRSPQPKKKKNKGKYFGLGDQNQNNLFSNK